MFVRDRETERGDVPVKKEPREDLVLSDGTCTFERETDCIHERSRSKGMSCAVISADLFSEENLTVSKFSFFITLFPILRRTRKRLNVCVCMCVYVRVRARAWMARA